MLKILIAFLAFLMIARKNARRKRYWLTPSSFLICLYTFSILMSIFHIIVNNETLVLDDKYWGPSVFMTVMLLAFLYPVLLFNEASIQTIRIPNRKLLDLFSNLIIFLSIYSILYYSQTVITILRGDLGALRSALYAGESYVETGIWNTIASTSSSMYVFALLLFFTYLCIGASKARLTLLFFSSFSNPIHVLAFVGRDGIVFWIFAFIYLYLLFKPFLPVEASYKLKKIALIGGTFLLVPFFAITIGRFQEGPGAFNSIIDYFGQPFVNGALYFGIDDPPLSPGSAFPLFYEFTGISMPEDSGRWEMGGTVSWVFGTFLKGLYSSLNGIVGILFLCISSGLFFYSFFGKAKSQMSFSKLFIYILYFEVFAQGVFYFRQYTRGGNLFIVICIFSALVFKYIQKSGKTIVLNKESRK